MNEIFIQNKIYNLSENDFYLDTPAQMALKEKRRILILFIDNLDNNKHIHDVWIDISRKVTNVLLGVLNLDIESNIKASIENITSNTNNPFRNLLPNIFPSIVVYIDGYPQKIVNCDYNHMDILDYCINF